MREAIMREAIMREAIIRLSRGNTFSCQGQSRGNQGAIMAIKGRSRQSMSEAIRDAKSEALREALKGALRNNIQRQLRAGPLGAIGDY